LADLSTTIVIEIPVNRGDSNVSWDAPLRAAKKRYTPASMATRGPGCCIRASAPRNPRARTCPPLQENLDAFARVTGEEQFVNVDVGCCPSATA